MRAFVFGDRGLVGSALREAAPGVEGTDLPEGDVTRPERIREALGSRRPDWIVNLAARTAVDACEADPEGTFAANALGAENVARLAAEVGARLLFVSTDYVFDGRKGTPYAEGDERNPLSVYGRSKAAGEDRVRAAMPQDRLLLVRGQSLYGRGDKSFPDAILARAHSWAEIPVVTDQVVQPTWARDFAVALALLMERNAAGTFHFAASGSCSWNEFAHAALEARAKVGERPLATIVGTTAARLGRAAPRPANSVFDTGKYEKHTGSRPRTWREMIDDYAREFWRAP